MGAFTVAVHTIRDAILTCNQKLTRVKLDLHRCEQTFRYSRDSNVSRVRFSADIRLENVTDII